MDSAQKPEKQPEVWDIVNHLEKLTEERTEIQGRLFDRLDKVLSPADESPDNEAKGYGSTLGKELGGILARMQSLNQSLVVLIGRLEV